MIGNTLYLFVGALVAGVIGAGVWASQEQPGFDLALASHGLTQADR